MFVQVENFPDLVKAESGAVVNKNVDEFQEFVKRREEYKNLQINTKI